MTSLAALARGPAGRRQVGQVHFGILAREDQPVRAGFQRGGHGGVGVVGRGFAAVLPVGMPMSMPGRMRHLPCTPASARCVSRKT